MRTIIDGTFLRKALRLSELGVAERALFKTHTYKIQPKAVSAKRRSQEKRVSSFIGKNDSLSVNFRAKRKPADCAGVRVEEKAKRRNRLRQRLLKKGLLRKKSVNLEVKRVLGIHCILLVVMVVFWSSFSFIQACPGRFVNPITDICWSCMFPLTIGPVNINRNGRDDTPNPGGIICFCPRPPIPQVPGIPAGFWEPVRLVDITRIPFCMVNLGGIKMGNSTHHYGVHGARGEGRTRYSFYQVHWYVYPVIYWFELLVDFLCLEQMSFDVGYLTEFDPLWNEDELSFLLNPEAVAFGNPIAALACAADCAAASTGFPMDALFWCGGCQGSIYPFTGNNPAHMGGVQASLLMVQRMMAKLHRELLLWGTSGTKGLCRKYPLPVIKKTQYKTQMTYPRPTTKGPMACNPLGRTEVIWGSGREFPYKGEDFGYLIWRKRNCCIL